MEDQNDSEGEGKKGSPAGARNFPARDPAGLPRAPAGPPRPKRPAQSASRTSGTTESGADQSSDGAHSRSDVRSRSTRSRGMAATPRSARASAESLWRSLIGTVMRACDAG